MFNSPPDYGMDAGADWFQCVLCNRMTTEYTELDADSCHPRCRRVYAEELGADAPVPKFGGEPVFSETDDEFTNNLDEINR